MGYYTAPNFFCPLKAVFCKKTAIFLHSYELALVNLRTISYIFHTFEYVLCKRQIKKPLFLLVW